MHKKKSCRDMRLKKKIVPQKFYTPPPGISNGPPLKSIRSLIHVLFCIYLLISSVEKSGLLGCQGIQSSNSHDKTLLQFKTLCCIVIPRPSNALCQSSTICTNCASATWPCLFMHFRTPIENIRSQVRNALFVLSS